MEELQPGESESQVSRPRQWDVLKRRQQADNTCLPVTPQPCGEGDMIPQPLTSPMWRLRAGGRGSGGGWICLHWGVSEGCCRCRQEAATAPTLGCGCVLFPSPWGKWISIHSQGDSPWGIIGPSCLRAHPGWCTSPGWGPVLAGGFVLVGGLVLASDPSWSVDLTWPVTSPGWASPCPGLVCGSTYQLLLSLGSFTETSLKMTDLQNQ